MGAVVLLPYLSLDKRIVVGPWTIIPRSDFKPEDAASEAMVDVAKNHLALYSLPAGNTRVAERCGCFAVVSGGKVGDPINPSAIWPLRLSILVGLLELNPAEDAANPGLRASTSDNAAVFGHPVRPEGALAVEFGFMFRTTVGGIKVAANPDYIRHGPELHLPDLGSSVDAELAGALHSLLVQNSDEARRLTTSIEWLDIAWRNTVSITAQPRVLALKSGFEALLNVGDRVEDGRAALSALLDAPTAPKVARNYTKLNGQPATIHVTDLEWWFTQFAFLRNKIAHGSAVPDADWKFSGNDQIMLAQRYLLNAIKKKTADLTGDAGLLKSPSERRVDRILGEFQAQAPEAPEQM